MNLFACPHCKGQETFLPEMMYMEILVPDILVPFFSPTTPKREENGPRAHGLCSQAVPKERGCLEEKRGRASLQGCLKPCPSSRKGCLLGKGRAGGGSCLFLPSLAGSQLGRRRKNCSKRSSSQCLYWGGRE